VQFFHSSVKLSRRALDLSLKAGVFIKLKHPLLVELIGRYFWELKEKLLRMSVPWLSRVTAAMLGVCVASGFAVGADTPHYLITNDDVAEPATSSITFYSVAADGLLTMKTKVALGVGGIGGGYFAANRVNVLDGGNAECVYASQAATGEIEEISAKTLTLSGHASGSKKDTGASNGVGLAMTSQYLYASFTDHSTIGTFQVKPDCKLRFVGDVKVVGLQKGTIDGMVVHGSTMVVTYGDGSIESFKISEGKPVSNGDEQNSTGSHNGDTYPSGIDITQDGHYAIFGDTSPFTIIEVSDISSGKLTPTVVYHLGNELNSSNILLSPDETLLYISNNQSGTITAAFFNKTTGKLTKGCATRSLKDFATDWVYLGALGLEKTTGTGGVVYVAEFAAPLESSSIGIVTVKSTGGTCTLKEASVSPASDPNSQGLLSIGVFPPRPF
jgi:hypothetical protein